MYLCVQVLVALGVPLTSTDNESHLEEQGTISFITSHWTMVLNWKDTSWQENMILVLMCMEEKNKTTNHT